MTLEELRKISQENNGNFKATLITVIFNQDYVKDNCLEFGNYNNIGHRPCLKFEKINFKKGQEFKTVNFDIQEWGVQRDIKIDYSSININYNGKNINIPISKVNIINAKSISQSEANDLSVYNVTTPVPTQSDKTNPDNTNVAPQTFLEKNKTNLLILGALVLGYLAYKKFNK
jgi:hypothetical protein